MPMPLIGGPATAPKQNITENTVAVALTSVGNFGLGMGPV